MFFKHLIIWLLLLSFPTFSAESLDSLVKAGKWQALAGLFLDDSHQSLRETLSSHEALEMVALDNTRYFYRVKFKDWGEMGVIEFSREDNKYFNLRFRNRVKPLEFIDSFHVYPVSNTRIPLGDAVIHLTRGEIYMAEPSGGLFLFLGQWEFYIRPGEKEEQITLERKFNRDFFQQKTDRGLFCLDTELEE